VICVYPAKKCKVALLCLDVPTNVEVSNERWKGEANIVQRHGET
jgi:hypothetical protein